MAGNGRRRARRALLQVLYEVDASRHSLETALPWVLSEAGLSKESCDFLQTTATQILAHLAELDDEIQRYASERPVSQLPAVDRNILRIAVYELEVEKSTPPKVAINEAVELAKQFGSEASQRFVNGVLGSLMKDLAPVVEEEGESFTPTP